MGKSISSITKKKLTQESRSTCPFCGEDDVSTAEIHHIIPVSKGGNDLFENLIYICANCHSKVTQGEILHSEVSKVKNLLGEGKHPFFKDEVTSNDEATSNIVYVDFTKGTNSGVVANAIQNLEINTTQRRVNLVAPQGSIAASLRHMNYIKYLIDRYHEFKAIEIGKEVMNYPIFYQNIKRKFGANWKMVPSGRFEDLVAYIKSRIDNTRHGRGQKALRRKNYSSFEEYLAKHGYLDC
ncbi:MAG: HNH endonuclease signature motif containing protein [Bryobacterales bacterium]|nr:HNH endonuclease signature motif containing protein [Bryobacterales bacterium]